MTRSLSLLVSLSLLCAYVSAQHITQTGLPALPYVTKNGNHFSILADSDTIAPTIGGFTFNPKTLDYSLAFTNNLIAIQAVVWDNTGGSGVYTVACAFTDPSGNYTYVINLSPPSFLRPVANGTWTGTFVVPNFQLTGLPENGTWTLTNITSTDLVGNVAVFNRGQAQQKSFPTSFQVLLPSPMSVLDVAYPTSQVDVKKADNPLQFATVPFNCTTNAPPVNSNTQFCAVYFQCADKAWATGQGTPRGLSTTQYAGTMLVRDWHYFTGACNLQGILTSYNVPSGGQIIELYGTADPATMFFLFPPNAAPAVLASPLVLVLCFALAFFLGK